MNKKVFSYFNVLQSKLAVIYDEREASNIAIIVFEDAFNIPNAAVSEQDFSSENQEKFTQILSELLQKKPWQYVLGEADFYGLKFDVGTEVLIPRVETEELVNYIITKHKNQAARILDIGTGSGCIAVTLQENLKDATVLGVDVSRTALALAKQNALKNNSTTKFQQLDVLDAEASQKMPKYDVIVSNPPYIQQSEKHLMPYHVLTYEPQLALFVTNNDPLQFYKAIAHFAFQHLHTNGWLYFEINEYFGKEVLDLLKDKGFVNCELVQDMFGKDRIALARL
jgi:release factor glutamine methyltransferase